MITSNYGSDKSAPGDRTSAGPLDSEEVRDLKPIVDFGSLRVAQREGLQMRLEVEETSQRIVALTLELVDSTLQVQAFAAPRSEGLWHEIRRQLGQSILEQAGEFEERIGAFGPELIAKLPQYAEKGLGSGFRLARFIGVDGPRWFLRGVVGGAALTDTRAGADIDDLFRSIIVCRGETPVPPRDLLELKLPQGVVSPPRPKF